MCFWSAEVLFLSQIGLKQAFQNQTQSVLIEYLIPFPNQLLLQNWCLLWGYVSLIGHDDCWGNLSLWRENFNVSHKGAVVSQMERQGIQEHWAGGREAQGHMDYYCWGYSAQQELQTQREQTSTITQQKNEWMVG